MVGSPQSPTLLLYACNQIVKQEFTPRSSKQCLIIPIPKSTDKNPADPSNYHGITLVSVKHLRKSSSVAFRQLVSLTNYIHSKQKSKRPMLLSECPEGSLCWIVKFNVLNLPNIATLNQNTKSWCIKKILGTRAHLHLLN